MFSLDRRLLRKKLASMQTADKIRFHTRLAELVEPHPNSVVADLGCGHGNTIKYLLPRIGKKGKIYGVDNDPALLGITEHLYHDALASGQLELIQSDLDHRLPFPDDSVDRLVSHNVLECIGDKVAFINECHRVLRKGGILVMSHTDWDSQIYNSSLNDLSRKLVHLYSDTTQDWMRNSDGTLGRKLNGIFAKTRFKKRYVAQVYPTVDYEFRRTSYAYRISLDIMAVARGAGVPEADVRCWYEDLRSKARKKEFYYVNLTNIVIARKP